MEINFFLADSEAHVFFSQIEEFYLGPKKLLKRTNYIH